MRAKKIFAVVIALLMLCTTIISANAANTASERQPIYYKYGSQPQVATAVYTLKYNPNMNCVRATNAVYYITSAIDAAQRNFTGYIYMDVTLSVGSDDDWDDAYLATSGNYAEFSLDDYYIPAGKTLTKATAYFETNEFVGMLVPNQNYTTARTEQDLVVP